MLSIKNIDISDVAINTVLKVAHTFWNSTPPWLRGLLILVILFGGGYFLYTRISMSYDVSNLEKEIATLNEKCATTVFYDRYVYDVVNLIYISKSLENEIDLMYQHNEQIVNLFTEFIETNHPEDHKFVKDVNNIKMHLQIAKESYDRTLKNQLSQYDNWTPENKHYDKDLSDD